MKADSAGPDLFDTGASANRFAPLAERMRPRSPGEFVGQAHLFGPGAPLREMMERRILHPLLLWGPPGSGKTTIARLLAEQAEAECVALNAVTDGIPRLREVIQEAQERQRLYSRRTVLWVDEIHRWAKPAQEVMLPHVESGLFVLIGATTENPSFEVRPALLSRCRVYRLEEVTTEEIHAVLERALVDPQRGLGERRLRAAPDALQLLAESGAGDVRKALGGLELAARFTADGGEIDRETARKAIGAVLVRHDRAGDQHYDVASAFQKSIRGSDPQAAMYWLARLLAGGDVSMVVRRMLVIAAEDIGMADPQALLVVEAAARAFERVGLPEGELFLAEAVTYLATAPKSNRSYLALEAAKAAVQAHPSAAVPLHLRNAPTALLREMGHKEGYRYAFDERHFYAAGQRYLPPELEGATFYEPGPFGHERQVRERMAWWARADQAARGETDEATGDG